MGDVTDRNEMLITYRHITNPLATSLFSIFVASRLALFCYVKMAFFLLEIKLSAKVLGDCDVIRVTRSRVEFVK